MAQVYGIPQYPVYSPLAGIAELYKTYKDIQRQEAQDAYAKEKDAKTFGLQEQELQAMRERMALDAETAGRRMQHEGALQQNKLDWEKDPNNPDTQYRLGMVEVARQNANTQAGLGAAHANLYAQQAADTAATRELMSKFGNIIMEAQQKAGQPATPLSSMTAPNTPAPEDKFVAQPITAAQQYAPTTASPSRLSDAELQALVLQQQRAMRGTQGYDGSSWITPRQVGTDSRGAIR